MSYMTISVRASARRKALPRALRRRRGGLTIYGLAQALGRPYRRVFDAVHRLAAEGALRLERASRGNRRATLLFAAPAAGPRDKALPAHLTAAERQALAALAARMGRIDPRVRALELFGSRARGDSRWDSDLDVAVRVRGRRDAALEARIVAAFAEVEWSTPFEGALRISPLVLFDQRPQAPLAAAIAKEGIPVWKAHARNSPAGNSRRRRGVSRRLAPARSAGARRRSSARRSARRTR